MADNVKDLINYPESIDTILVSKSTSLINPYLDVVLDNTKTVLELYPLIDSYKFIQTDELAKAGIAVHSYGAIVISDGVGEESETPPTLLIEHKGVIYTGPNIVAVFGSNVGRHHVFTKAS